MKSASDTSSGAGNQFSAGLRRLAQYVDNVRPGDWWEFKVPPLLATAYATALFLQVPFRQLWPLLLLLLFALLPGAAYVSVINDITDLERVEGLSGGRVDLTFGSALDLFGGSRVRYADCVAWNRVAGRSA